MLYPTVWGAPKKRTMNFKKPRFHAKTLRMWSIGVSLDKEITQKTKSAGGNNGQGTLSLARRGRKQERLPHAPQQARWVHDLESTASSVPGIRFCTFVCLCTCTCVCVRVRVGI